jgi:hypothetical protein
MRFAGGVSGAGRWWEENLCAGLIIVERKGRRFIE